MKKTLLFKFLALSLFMLFGIGVLNAQNLVLNGDMEAWDDDTSPTSWTKAENITKESTIVHGGTYSAKHVGGTKDLSQTITINPNTEYTISIWYYVESGDDTDARIWSYWRTDGTTLDDNAAELRGPDGSYFTSAASWQQYEVTLTSPAAANELYFEVRTYGSAIVYWDDMSVTEATTVATDLFFSEYIEGTSNNRAIEIFNGTGADVDLSAYSVKQSYGGQGWGIRSETAMIEYVLPLSGTLADGDVYIFYNTDADAAISSVGDLALSYDTGTQGSRMGAFTGNDPMGLFKNDVLIDIIGIELDTDGPWDVAGTTGATQNHTLTRKSTITQGNTDWAASAGTDADDSEWVVYAEDYFDDLGTHTFGESSADVTAPTFTSTPDDGDTEVAVDAVIVLTFNEAIRNIDDSDITDENVATLLTLKETDASGSDVAFTATIDAAKKVITVTPNTDLKNDQVYYGAIISVEDTSDNASAASSMTFTTEAVIVYLSLPLYEGFDYTADETLGEQVNWNNLFSGDEVLIETGSLSYPDFHSSSGNSISFNGGGFDPQIEFEAVTSGTVYSSFLFKVTDQSAMTDLTDGGYFAFLGNYDARLWVRPNPDAAGTTFDIGFGWESSAPSTTTTTYNVGDVILAVISYNIDTDELSAWINPSSSDFGADTAPTALLTSTDEADVTSISAFVVRQDSDGETPFIQMDELRIGTSWAEVVVGSGVGIDDLSGSTLNIYPNPSTGRFYLQMGDAFKANTKVEVFNVVGMKVFETLATAYKTEIDLSAMKQGVYYVRVDDGQNIITQKIMKQ